MPSTLSAGLNLSAAQLTYDDEFDSFTASPDGSVGYRTTFPFGGTNARSLPGNGELQYYSDSSVGVNPFTDKNGVLTITAAAAAPNSNPQNLPYTSGLATTQGMFQQEYGYFEMTAKPPAGVGLWSAFWLLPANGLGGAELDAFEVLGHYPYSVFTTTHSVNANGVHSANSVYNPLSFDLSASFHTYGVDWEPDRITWYLDGQQLYSQATPVGFDTPMYILMNLAVGGFGGTPTDPSVFPAGLQIDSLHAYATANTIRTSGSAAIATASLAGTVHDTGGHGIGGVTVGLVDAAGNLLSSLLTDINGYFIFTTLTAGSYKVVYGLPAGMAPAAGGPANATTGLTAPVSLAVGQSLLLQPETLQTISAAAITGTVLKSATVAGAGTPVSGETVRLLSGSTVIASTITLADGSFTFTNLAAGSYTVQYTGHTGEALRAGGPANTTTGMTGAIAVTAGHVSSLAAQTLAPAPGAVSGNVLYSASGAQGATGTALAGVTVALLTRDGQTVLATQTTASNGTYLFGGLDAGLYLVRITPTDGNVLLNGGIADVASFLTNAIFVTAGNRTVAGTETLMQAASASAIAGSVLYAAGGSGAPAAAQAGVTVLLLNASGTVVTSTVSDANGVWRFANLGSGSYKVQFAAPSGEAFHLGGPADILTGVSGTIALASAQTVQVAPETLIPNTPAVIGGVVLFQPNPYQATPGAAVAFAGESVSLLGTDGVARSTVTTDANGRFVFTGLLPGRYTIRYALPANDVFRAGGPVTVTTGTVTGLSGTLTVEAGQTTTLAAETLAPTPASLSGSASYNGAAEGYVAVSLIDGGGAVVASMVTAGSGKYTFANLAAGSYRVRYTPPKAQAFQSGPVDPATGLTGVVTLTAGQGATLADEVFMPAPASVAGSVRLASGLAQVGVAISVLAAGTGSVVASTVTAADGSFQVAGLVAGSYMLQYTPPAGEVLTAGPASTTTGQTGAFTLAAGQALTMTRATVAASNPASIGGAVLFSQGSSSAAQAGVVVTLIAGPGNAITTTTGSNGSYQFKNLPAGSYQIGFAAPSGDALRAGGPANPTTGLTGTIAVAAGQNLTLASEVLIPAGAATIGGSVQFSGGGQAGVAIALLSGSQTVGATTTDATGAFAFTGLAAGSYQVRYTAPPGEALAAGGPGDAATGTTAAIPVTVGQSVTLAAETLVSTGATLAGSVQYQGSGQAGVAVSLLRQGSSESIATTTSNASGGFAFAGLAAGSYQLRFTAPSGEAPQAGSLADATGLTASVTLAAGQSLTLAPEVFVAQTVTPAITGIFRHVGSGDPGTGQSGATISLLNASGTVLRTTVTGAGGAFGFVNPAVGSYRIRYAPPAGEAIAAGGPADATGTTAVFSYAAGQVLALAIQDEISSSTTFVLNGPMAAAVRGDGDHVVTGTASNGRLTLGSGTQSVTLSGFADTVTTGDGNQAVTLAGSANVVTVGAGTQAIDAGTGFGKVTLGATPAGTTSAVKLTGSGNTVTATGDGSVSVTGPVGSTRVTLGNGNQSVTLGGSGNTVTVGAGTSTIAAGQDNNVIHAAGGAVTISVSGQGNLLDAGPGTNTLTALAGSRLDTFLLNGSNQGLTTINGFNASDMLDLKRTLAGTSILPDLSNIGHFVTASSGGGGTILFVDPTGGSGAPYAFATLTGVNVTVAQLVSGHQISLA